MKNLTRIIAALLCLSVLTGCSGGSIYSNYRELEQITVIQTMGFDRTSDGVLLTVSSGEGISGASSQSPKTSCLFAEGRTVTLAREKMQDLSASEQLFFAHTSYIAIGSDTARSGVKPYLDYVARIPDLRLDVPLFVIEGSTASELIRGAGGKDYDATSVFKSLERNLELRGDCPVFSAAQILPALDKNGCALITAVKTEKADGAVEGAKKGELTAVPDGLVIIKCGRTVGKISPDDSLGVSLLLNKAGPASVELTSHGVSAVAVLDKCSCEIKPKLIGGRVEGVYVSLELSAALSEINGELTKRDLESALEMKLRQEVCNVLAQSKTLGCDFLQLGSIFARQKPFELAGIADTFSDALRDIYYNVEVTASLDRSFDVEL